MRPAGSCTSDGEVVWQGGNCGSAAGLTPPLTPSNLDVRTIEKEGFEKMAATNTTTDHIAEMEDAIMFLASLVYTECKDREQFLFELEREIETVQHRPTSPNTAGLLKRMLQAIE